MSGSKRSRSMLNYYEYFLPGIYDYPVTHSAEDTFSAYYLDPILASGSSSWSISSATYVAGPLGVINYLSDVQTHLALPISQNLVIGNSLIYTTLSSDSLDSYPHHPPHDYSQMEEDDGYGYEFPQLNLCLARFISDSEGEREPVEESHMDQSADSQCFAKSYSSVEISEQSGSGESVQSEEVPKKKRKVSHKRTYQAEQGYLVEEPTSELSEEDPEELLPTSRK